jgi:uncharacterized protein
MPFFKSSENSSRIFFATDIHGSDLCWRKFLNAAAYYGAQTLIMGGDMMGKMLVPITREGAAWRADYAGRTHRLETRTELATFTQQLADVGVYSYECEEDELTQFTDPASREELIRIVALERARKWMELADERLAGKDVDCFAQPGNDDLEGIDELIESSQTVRNSDGSCAKLRSGHELIATGYSNITPWRTARELDEEELGVVIDGLFKQLEQPATAIASLHVPPFGSNLDNAPRLDDQFQVQTRGGQADMVPVGSTAVRDAITKHQPLLALHGHIHESPGRFLLGRTVCVNPGSEYQEGVLQGALIRLGRDRVENVQFVRG